jgi:membrane fusion protein (multidrug efflux system)
MRPGQPVEIVSDLYGADVRLRGHVESIGTGTGSVFSLLPPQNATGNWIKIVQRVPVRIALEQAFDRQHPLPFGASLYIRVDTHARGALPLASDEPTAPVADADIYQYQDEGAEALITRIIADNSN